MTNLRRRICLSLVFVSLSITTLVSAQAQDAQPKANVHVPDDKHYASLADVTKAVTEALTQVKQDPSFQKGPQLKSAEFDYQTVTTTTASGGISILGIVTLEGSKERDATSETDFTYEIPDKSHLFGLEIGGWFQKIKDFFANKTQADIRVSQALPAAIKAAAMNMQNVPSLTNPSGPGLTQRTYVVSLSFAVKNDFNGKEDPSSLVVVAPTVALDHSKAYTQTVKLTFVDQPGPSHVAAISREALEQDQSRLFTLTNSPKFLDAVYAVNATQEGTEEAQSDMKQYLADSGVSVPPDVKLTYQPLGFGVCINLGIISICYQR